MNCEICNKGISEGVSLYRQNAKGQSGIWRCSQHDAVRDEETHEIVSAIESGAWISAVAEGLVEIVPDILGAIFDA